MNCEVEKLAREIVAREGGLVDDPNDRGGVTNCGVSLRYAKGKGLVMDLDGDGDVDGDDIRLVSPDLATQLYIHDFFSAPSFDLLPAATQPVMFDSSVLYGPGGATKLLQMALNGFGYGLKVDGGCGPLTRATAHQVWTQFGNELVNAIVKERIAKAYAIANADPTQAKYVRTVDGGEGGWIKRAKEFCLA